jgi:Cu-Zn family superoxide dismutase
MRKTAVVGVFVLLGAGSLALAKGKKPATKTEAKPAIEVPVEAKSGSKVNGKATFTEKGKEITVKVVVDGAPPGDHAVHIHEKGDCSAPDAKSAGGHWNPQSDQHGAWTAEHHHLGDIGNMKVGADGKGEVTLTTDKWTIGSGQPNDVVGKSIVVHEKIDDFTTQPTGNAGGRIGCAVLAKGETAGGEKAPSTAEKTPAAAEKTGTPAKK